MVNQIILNFLIEYLDLNKFIQNKKSINTPNSFNHLNKLKNNNYISNGNMINNDNINTNMTQFNFNEICNYKMEINKLVEENINLKSELVEIKSKISQFENMLERTDLKYQEQMNNYQKQLIKYNNYIHEVYVFFNNISNNFYPKLNFSLQKNEFILINFDSFQSKLKLIEKYILDLNKKLNSKIKPNIYNTNSNYLLTEISFDKNNLEERVNFLEKKIMKKGIKKIPINLNNNNINNSLRNKYDYFRVNKEYNYGKDICPKYQKSKLFNKISNTKLNNDRYEKVGSSFCGNDDNSNKNRLNNKNYNFTSLKKNKSIFITIIIISTK